MVYNGTRQSPRLTVCNMILFSGRMNFLSMCGIVVLAAVIGVTTVGAELKLVNVIFRHGDRTPDNTPDEMYPNDPYLNDTFYPMGRGQLTNRGKMREYTLGRFLRGRYASYLGDIYTPRSVSALSSDYDRTKMSLQLVLAGLFPPDKIQQWNSDLHWQPVPAQYLRRYEDNLFLPEDCLLYAVEYQRVLQSPQGREGLSKYDELMANLTNWTGKNITAPLDLYYLYHTLMAEYSMGYTLPAWTKDIFPKGELFNATVFSYEIANSTPLLRRLYGGPWLRIVTRAMLNVVSGAQVLEKKIHLFSGHESNIAAVLSALGAYYPHVPEYSSAIILELHRNDDSYYVKVLYYVGIPSEAYEIRIPNCDVLCPMDKYLQLVEGVIPSNEEMICDKGLAQEFLDRKSTEELELLKYNLIKTAGVVKAK